MSVSPADKFPLPPQTTRADGAERRVGVELEMIGLEVEEIVDVLRQQLGGQTRRISDYQYELQADDGLLWQVELDVQFLKDKARLRQQGRESHAGAEDGESIADTLKESFIDTLSDALGEAAENVLRLGAEQVAPKEIVGPPLPLSALGLFDELVARLRQRGARGTSDGVAYAFGLQFNPELPALDAATITRYFKAYLCLSPWLKHEEQVDLTRRLTTFADPFPKAYIKRVVEPGYQPSLAQFMDDYLAFNPTRNRELDLLPLFHHLDEQRLRAVVSDMRVKPRPTFHYRLPNADIHRADWGIHLAWQRWLQVEHLAEDAPRLETVCRAYAAHLEQLVSLDTWQDKVTQWLLPPLGPS